MNDKKENHRISLHDTIENEYKLGESEIIAKDIIKVVINYALLEIRKKFIRSLRREYVLKNTFNLIEDFVRFKLIEFPPFDASTNDELIITQTRQSKIDTWASNKTKIGLEDPKKDHNNEIYKGHLLVNFRPFEVKNKEKNNNKRQFDDSIGKNTDKSSSSHNIASNLPKTLVNVPKILLNNNEIAGLNKNKKLILTEHSSSKNKKDSTERSLISLVDDNPKKIMDENELCEYRALTTYFNQKEQDIIRKKKIEKDLEEKLIEEEKQKKKINDNLKVHSYDADGKFIFIKPIDPEKLTTFAYPKYQIKRKTKRSKDLNKEIKTNTYNVLTNESNGKFITVPNDPKEVFLPPEIYSQPDPLITVIPSNGVNLTSSGKTKAGNMFSFENRMNQKEFDLMLTKLYPKRIHVNNKLFEHINDEIKDLKENSKTDNLNEEYPIQKRLSNIFITEDEEIIETLNNIKSNPSITNFKKCRIKDPNDKLNKSKISNGMVKKSQDFNYQNINRIDNDDIYHNFAPNSYSLNGTNRKSIMNLPISKHGLISQELGILKKYPRERMPQNILAISGKLEINYHKKNHSHDIKKINKSKINIEEK